MLRWILLLLIALPSAFANRLIIEPEMGRAPLIKALQESKHSIQLVMYGFTDPTLRDTLLSLHNRTVQVILEAKPYRAETENNTTIAAFQHDNIAWHGGVQTFRLIHQKTLLIDGSEAWVMTFNFTQSSFKQQRNFAVVLDDARTVHEIGRLFSADWNQKAYALPMDFQNTLLLSPDNSRTVLTQLINQAHSSIDIYAQTLNDYQIIGTLEKAGKRGVKIRLLTTGKLRDKQSAYLEQAGVTIQYVTKLMIHAKALIIDGQKAMVGSTNLTRSSLDNNRELSVITTDRAIVDPLKNTFAKDWGQKTLSTTTALPRQLPGRQEPILAPCERKLAMNASLKSVANCLLTQAARYILSAETAKLAKLKS